jgi:hypothetical protein
MKGSKFIGVTFLWGINAEGIRTVTLSMPGYVDKALQRFHVTRGPTRVNSPMRFTPPRYATGTPQVGANETDTSAKGTAADTARLQEIVGVFLYLARCVDGLATIAINRLSSAQSKPTAHVMGQADDLLQYFAWHPDPSVTFSASDMRLFAHTDASFAGEPDARSRIGAVYMLGDVPLPGCLPVPRHPILVTSVILPTVAASVTEAEYGGAFHAAQRAVPLRNTLAAIGHPQPATELITDNAVADGICNNTIKERRSRAVNISFHWLRDQVKLNQFSVRWAKGSSNLADYQTKAVPTAAYVAIKPAYQNSTDSPIENLNPHQLRRRQHRHAA